MQLLQTAGPKARSKCDARLEHGLERPLRVLHDRLREARCGGHASAALFRVDGAPQSSEGGRSTAAAMSANCATRHKRGAESRRRLRSDRRRAIRSAGAMRSALRSGKGGVSEGARTSASTCPPRTSASGNNAAVATDNGAPAVTSGLLDDACRGDVRTVSRGGPRARGERAGLRARLAAAVLPAARAAVWASRTYRAGRRPGRAGGERRGPFGKSNASWVWGVG